MRSPFKPYKNADLYFPKTSNSQYSELLIDDYGNPVDISNRPTEEIHIEAYLVAIPNWKFSEGRLFGGGEKGSGDRVRGGGHENYLSYYGYVISPLDLPKDISGTVLNGKAEIKMRSERLVKGNFKLIEVYQSPAVIPYQISKIITRINGIFSWN